MRVVISQNHLSLNEKLAKEVNKSTRNFNVKTYSKIEGIDNILVKRNIPVEKKKNILIRKLHESIIKAFSIKKIKFNTKTFDILKIRLHNIRKIVTKLRSINYYLETTFFEELKIPKMKINNKNPKLKQDNLARDELETLEYTAYKLIGEVVMLDNRLLKEYAKREKKIMVKEKLELEDLGSILRKESMLLEHLEAKLPPPKAASMTLIKEPLFTHWAARIFALLAYLEHIYSKEAIVFNKLKKNKAIKTKINKKIIHIIKEKSKLLRLMEEKLTSMKTFRINNKLKHELHNFTTTITL